MVYNTAKKAAVLAMIATGESVRKSAEKNGVDPSTASRWAKATPPPIPVAPPLDGTVIAAPNATVLQQDATQKNAREDVEGRLYGYMLASIDTLEAQIRLFGNPDWLKTQSAGELSQLHYVVAERTAGLLTAFEAGINQKNTGD